MRSKLESEIVELERLVGIDKKNMEELKSESQK